MCIVFVSPKITKHDHELNTSRETIQNANLVSAYQAKIINLTTSRVFFLTDDKHKKKSNPKS